MFTAQPKNIRCTKKKERKRRIHDLYSTEECQSTQEDQGSKPIPGK